VSFIGDAPFGRRWDQHSLTYSRGAPLYCVVLSSTGFFGWGSGEKGCSPARKRFLGNFCKFTGPVSVAGSPHRPEKNRWALEQRSSEILFVCPATCFRELVQMRVKSPKVETRHLCSAIKGCELEGQRASQPWQAGNYQLAVDGALEDLAAN